MLSSLTSALRARSRRSSRIFIAWSNESKGAAESIRLYLNEQGFSTWISQDIKGGRRFREEIGDQIRNSDLVVAVFPTNPSHWIVAEAGLAYFEQKLIPVVVGTDFATDPFEDLHILKFPPAAINARSPETLESLLGAIEDRLGSDPRSVLWYILRLLNFLFFSGIPIIGITVVASLLWRSLNEPDDPYRLTSLQLWKAGHIVLGAVVYGGSIFIALLFSRAGISNSFIERHFCFLTAQRLFVVWFVAVLLQALGGFYLLQLSPAYELTHEWVVLSLISYFITLISFLFGFIYYRAAYSSDAEGRERAVLETKVFIANVFFGIGFISLTLVIVLMSLKSTAKHLLLL